MNLKARLFIGLSDIMVLNNIDKYNMYDGKLFQITPLFYNLPVIWNCMAIDTIQNH